MTSPEQSGDPITAEGLEALRAELAQLEGPGRTAMAAQIKAARNLGDLKENAEYHIAKEEQAHLETRIRRLRGQLDNATVFDGEGGETSFSFGRTAEVLDEATGRVHTWKLVGAAEAKMAEGKLSVESPVGRAMRDREIGEAVSVEVPRGRKTYRVLKLLES